MRNRYFCDLIKFNEGQNILVALVWVFYFIAVLIGIIYYSIIGNLNVGTFFVSLLLLGNLGWIAYIIVLLPTCYFISLIHKNIDNLQL